MKLYSKILLISLPLILLAGLLNGGLTWHLARESQVNMSTGWLESRLGDANQLARGFSSKIEGLPEDDLVTRYQKQSAAATLAHMVVSEQGTVFVLDSSGTIVAHPDLELVGKPASEYENPKRPWVATALSRQAGKMEFVFNGERQLGVYEHFSPWDWTIVVSAPADVVYANINRARDIATTFYFITAALIAVVLMYLTLKITSPLELMQLGADEMGRGNFKIRIPVTSKDEVGLFARAFNRMADQLETSMETIAKSEKHYRSLIENTTDTILIINAEMQLIYASPTVAKTLGYRPWNVIGKLVFDYVHPDDLRTAATALQQIVNRTGTPGTQTLRIRDEQGEWRSCDVMAVNLLDEPTVSGVVLTLRDVRERVRDELLRASIYQISEAAFRAGTLEELFRAVHAIISKLMPAQNFYVALYDDEHQMLTFPYFVDEYEKAPPPSTLGRGLTEYVLRTGDPQLVSPERFDELVELGEVDSVGAPSIDWLGIPLIVNDRKLGVLVVQSYTEEVRFQDSDKEILMFVSEQAAMSITRKQAEDETKISEMRYRELFENSPVSLWEEDFTGIINIIDDLRDQGVKDFRSYFYSHPEVVNKCMASIQVLDVNQATIVLYGAESKLELMVNMSRMLGVKTINLITEEVIAIAEGKTEFVGRGVNYQVDGREIDVVLSWKMSAGPSRMIVCILDVTEQKKAEGQALSQLQRLNALRAIDMSITASLDLRSTLRVLLDQVSQQLNVDAAAVLLMDPHVLTLEYAASKGFRTAALQHTSLRLGEGYAGRAALERSLVCNLNLLESPGELRHAPLLLEEGFIVYYAAPLIAKGQVKGVLEIFHRTPMDPPQEWVDFLETLARQAAIAIDNATLFNDLQRSNMELSLAYDATIEGWSRALDMRDKETEGHTQRVTEATLELAMMLGVNKSQLVHLRWGALLHDIGKMGIPDSILLKPGSLDREERAIMHKHPIYAYEMLLPIAYLRPALDIPYYHHEKWDGSGYPCRLKGEEIPLAARIFSIIDVWDALRSDRPYRGSWSDAKVRHYIQTQSGKHFDPRIVNVFLQMISKDDFAAAYDGRMLKQEQRRGD